MTAYTAPQILAPLKLTISTADQEYIITAIVDQLNLWGAPTVNITETVSTPESMTWTLTSAEKAAVLFGARAIYSSFYKNAQAIQNNNIGQVSVSQADMMSNPTVLATIKAAAEQLRQVAVGDDLPIVIGTDDS
jgi:hypothetical protein